MFIYILSLIFLISVVIYVSLTNYKIQLLIRRNSFNKTVFNKILEGVKGRFCKVGYYSTNHKVVLKGEYKSFTNRHKVNFSQCFDIIRFKTQFGHMELFFSLIRENLRFYEVLNLRIFPYESFIKSEGNVEKNYSRLNIFTNNKYLTELLETHEMRELLNWLIRYNGDILLISKNNLHFKAFVNPKKLSYERIMDMIKVIHMIAVKIYKGKHIEY